MGCSLGVWPNDSAIKSAQLLILPSFAQWRPGRLRQRSGPDRGRGFGFGFTTLVSGMVRQVCLIVMLMRFEDTISESHPSLFVCFLGFFFGFGGGFPFNLLEVSTFLQGDQKMEIPA